MKTSHSKQLQENNRTTARSRKRKWHGRDELIPSSVRSEMEFSWQSDGQCFPIVHQAPAYKKKMARCEQKYTLGDHTAHYAVFSYFKGSQSQLLNRAEGH